MIRKIADGFAWVFSPILVPTYITLILLSSGFHFSMFSWPAKRFLILVVFISTAVMPTLTLLISELGKNYGRPGRKAYENKVSMLFVALYYYLGYFLLNRLPLYAIFKILLLAGAILVVTITVISMWQNISQHMAAAGGALGMMLALSLRIGTNPAITLSCILLAAGLTGTALIITNRHTLPEILWGYLTGFSILFLIFYFL
jgi:hypothetical protein